MKKLSILAFATFVAFCSLPPASADASSRNEYESFYGVTPVAQQADVADRTALINYGLLAADGTITATASSGAATLNKPIGTITTEALTTAAAATYTLTLTDSVIAATSKVFVSVDQNSSTGLPVVTSVTPGSGSVVIKVTNLHATAAFNAALKISFYVAK